MTSTTSTNKNWQPIDAGRHLHVCTPFTLTTLATLITQTHGDQKIWLEKKMNAEFALFTWPSLISTNTFMLRRDWNGYCSCAVSRHVWSWKRLSFIFFVFVASQTVSSPVKTLVWYATLTLVCSLTLCCLNPLLDLDIFPQILQEWEMLLVMWLTSMCCLIAGPWSSFPQTLHE